MTRFLLVTVFVAILILLPPETYGDERLMANWPLQADARDQGPHQLRTVNHGVRFENGFAQFNGRDAWLEVPEAASLFEGTQPFSISVWMHTAQSLDDVIGDVLTCYDPRRRHGFTLSVMNYAGVTSAQSNWRNVLFGIDADQQAKTWRDCGRPGENMCVKSLVVFDGSLYAATWEPGEGQRGHVYRYAGGSSWIDCGSPAPANALCGLAVFQGKLYAGSELYSGGGSALPVSKNVEHGGRVYCYEGGTRWTDVGKVADVRSISGLAEFQGRLYAGTGTSGDWQGFPRTRGMYRYDGEGQWTSCGSPDNRIVHLTVHNGHLYGLSYDAGGFFRYEGGEQWTPLGPVPDTTQVYSAAIYEGELHIGTWPTGSVFRHDGNGQWSHRGRLGNEQEVMGMAVYNGGLFAGTLPMADVYRYDGEGGWKTTGQLDHTPDVKYRRAWSMAVYDGRLFCGVLPSGHVHSLEVGKSVTYDKHLAPGWRHLAAVRASDQLQLYVDGELVAQRGPFDASTFALQPQQPLKIGFGQHDFYNGRMQDLKLYRGTLTARDIQQLARRRPSSK